MQQIVFRDPVPVDQWGKDHWSTLGYIETRIVDHGGRPEIRHMRCEPLVHPQFHHAPGREHQQYPTRLAGGAVALDHDDWKCLDDAEAAGLIVNVGTGLNRVYRLTDEGSRVCAALRKHKANGGSFGTFTVEQTRRTLSPVHPLAQGVEVRREGRCERRSSSADA